MDEKLKIALVQTSLIWEAPEKNRDNIARKLDNVLEDVDLIVLPEMFTTGFTMTPEQIDTLEGERTMSWMRQVAEIKNTALTGSIVYFDKGKYANRLFFVEPQGTISMYDKRHTFTLAGEDKVYQAGSERLIVAYRGFKICPMICYDLRFPVWARNTEAYDALIYVANWPKPRISAWDTLLKARAIENMAYCIGVNRIGNDFRDNEYPGHSAVYDALGELITHSKKEEILYATLSKEHIISTRKKLKFLEDRDNFNLVS